MQICTSYQHFRLRLPPDFQELYRRFGRITGCKSAHSHMHHEMIFLRLTSSCGDHNADSERLGRPLRE